MSRFNTSKYSKVYELAVKKGYTTDYVRENNFRLSLNLFKDDKNGLSRIAYKVIAYSYTDLSDQIENIK